MTDSNFDPSNNTIEDDIDPELSKQNEYDRIMDTINDLYSDVIMRFRSGSTTISNPYIMQMMTKTDFVNWIINNNEYVASILEAK